MRSRRNRWLLLGGIFGGGVVAVLVSALALFAGAGAAARADKPEVKNPPSISGTPEEGKTLTGDRGDWNNKPTDYDYFWLRCGKTGGSCSTINDAHNQKYTLTSADVGNTLRFKVDAKNSDGTTSATSVPTAVIQKQQTTTSTTTSTTTTTTSSRGSGCPSGKGNPDQVSGIAGPARLLVDALQSDPSRVTGDTNTLVVRFHVTSSCGGPVQGALVYATATPFNQWSVPPEGTTDASGWAALTFSRGRDFPLTDHQQSIAMFARARKPGEPLLGGVSTRRLFSIPVSLRG